MPPRKRKMTTKRKKKGQKYKEKLFFTGKKTFPFPSIIKKIGTATPLVNEFRELRTEKTKSIECGNQHLVFLMKNGAVHVFGNNKNGQLGVETQTHVPSVYTLKFPSENEEQPKILKALTNEKFSTFLGDNGKVYFCGKLNPKVKELHSKKIVELDLSPIPKEQKIETIFAGENRIFVLTKQIEKNNGNGVTPHSEIKGNEVYGIGNNVNGALGVGKTEKFVNKLTRIPLEKIDTRTKDEIDNLGKDGKKEKKKKEVKKEELGDDLIDAIINPELEQEIKERKIGVITSIACGKDHTLILTKNYKVYGCGSDKYGQIGLLREQKFKIPALCYFLESKKVIAMDCGRYHSAFITKKNYIFVCGKNNHGQLGTGNTRDQSTVMQLFPQRFAKNSIFKTVLCGDFHTFFISETRVFASGKNNDGQLGCGSYFKPYQPTEVVASTNIHQIYTSNEYSFFVRSLQESKSGIKTPVVYETLMAGGKGSEDAKKFVPMKKKKIGIGSGSQGMSKTSINIKSKMKTPPKGSKGKKKLAGTKVMKSGKKKKVGGSKKIAGLKKKTKKKGISAIKAKAGKSKHGKTFSSPKLIKGITKVKGIESFKIEKEESSINQGKADEFVFAANMNPKKEEIEKKMKEMEDKLIELKSENSMLKKKLDLDKYSEEDKFQIRVNSLRERIELKIELLLKNRNFDKCNDLKIIDTQLKDIKFAEESIQLIETLEEAKFLI